MRVNKLTAVILGAAALTTAASGIASASASTTAASTNPIVTVTHDNGGVQVGTGLPGQPLLSASVDNRGVCVGFSLEVPFCLPVSTG